MLNISGYVLALEYSNEGTDQRRPLPDNTTLPASGTLKVTTGATPVPDADVQLDYDGYVLNNEENGVVALLTPDEETVIASTAQDITTTTSVETTAPEQTTETSTGDATTEGTTSTSVEVSDDATAVRSSVTRWPPK